jgi:hypothetical protein
VSFKTVALVGAVSGQDALVALMQAAMQGSLLFLHLVLSNLHATPQFLDKILKSLLFLS